MPEIILKLTMPDTQAPTNDPKLQRIPVEDRVRHCLECIDSGHPSGVEWLTITKLYNALLAKKKLSPREKNIKKMIDPVIAKFGYHGTAPRSR